MCKKAMHLSTAYPAVIMELVCHKCPWCLSAAYPAVIRLMAVNCGLSVLSAAYPAVIPSFSQIF